MRLIPLANATSSVLRLALYQAELLLVAPGHVRGLVHDSGGLSFRHFQVLKTPFLRIAQMSVRSFPYSISNLSAMTPDMSGVYLGFVYPLAHVGV